MARKALSNFANNRGVWLCRSPGLTERRSTTRCKEAARRFFSFTDTGGTIACSNRSSTTFPSGTGRSPAIFAATGGRASCANPPDDIIDTQCLDLILLLNSLGIRQAVFVGIDYGGLIVQQIARQYPERAAAIVIADSFCRVDSSTVFSKLQLAAAYMSWLDYYAPGELLLPSLRLAYQRWAPAYDELRRNVLNRRPRELYRQRLATRRIDYTDHLRTFRGPALGVAGDYTAYGIACMEELVACLPQAGLAVIADARGPSSLCRPDAFNQVVEQFLNRHAIRSFGEAGSG
ncbi:alpha/beta hydrolase [Cohnella ginsengisoli]|uniref:Alpha/beta hydrolase n=2 Tax=Cohnella ginsengisoli TaxID=425004 RepID=A0A9X4KIQ7_9BACL|nr:alpha/beta hydrolase [Cohnella ginsengisoli]MDG0792718.1 alpha/beta hydrolase [Cohnella ginsengisoli]